MSQNQVQAIKQQLAKWKSGKLSSADFAFAVEKILSV